MTFRYLLIPRGVARGEGEGAATHPKFWTAIIKPLSTICYEPRNANDLH